MPPAPLSLEASIPLINEYCRDRHDGKLVCVLDPVKGRTLYATRPFAVGDIILEEPPLHAVQLDPSNAKCAQLADTCTQEAFQHPPIWYWCALNSVLVEGDPPVEGLRTITRRQWDLLRLLFIPPVVEPSPEAVALVESMGLRGIVEAVDVEIMIQVWLHNCFEHRRDPEGYIIYFMPSFCSHSCLPNALWSTDVDSNFRFSPRANISAGDEVTLTYIPEDDMLRSTSYRRELLEGAKYFKCMCERCDSPVDFSRGFRCPSCRRGVIYVHADETESKHAFRGPLLMEFNGQLTSEPPPCAAGVSRHSSLADDNSKSRGSVAPVQETQSLRMPYDISLCTIWARLLAEGKRHKEGVPTGNDSNVAGAPFSEVYRGPSYHQPVVDVAAPSQGAAHGPLTLEFSKTCALISPQATSQVLQIPQSGCCCFCHVSWTKDQRRRGLAAERLIEAAFSRSDDVEGDPIAQSPTNALCNGLHKWDPSKGPYLEGDEAEADKRARQVLQGIDLATSQRILKKRWHLLDRDERLVVDSIIRLTFRSHWLAAHWFRFLESTCSASRKLPLLDQIVWQYRNLYPGLSPAIIWAVWDVAQVLLSLEGSSKLKNSESFGRYADQCIVSAYNESVFVFSALFGADSSFVASIVDDYSTAFEKCKERIMRRSPPCWKGAAAAGCPKSDACALPHELQLPRVWPCYVSSWADVVISFSSGCTVIPGSILIGAYCNDG